MSARFESPLRLAARRAAAAALVLLLLGTTAMWAADPGASWGRRSRVAVRAGVGAALAPEEDPAVDKDALRLAARPLPKSGGLPPHPLACGDLSLVLDGFGGFGSASAGGDAHFDAGTGPRATVFEAMAHLRNSGFLDADSLMLPQSDAHSSESGGVVTASYVRGPFRFDLRSELVDCSEPHVAALQQAWTITNVSTRAQNLALTLYVDGDMFFAGDHRDDFGVITDDALSQFDQGSGAASTFLQLSSEAPQALAVIREVGEYSDQRRRINRNEMLRGGIVRIGGAVADADGDGITDSGFDVSLAIQHDFGSIAPGGSVSLGSRLQWGVGSIDGVDPEPFAVDLGPDRDVECEGHEGTLVEVSAVTEPAGSAAGLAWTVDGLAASGSDALSALLLPGEHVVGVRAVDAAGSVAEDSVVVRVLDTTAPVIAESREMRLWPPDHRLVPVDLESLVSASDACSDEVSLRPVSIESSEPDEVRRGGDGMFAADAVIMGGRAWVRRERQGAGDQRVYTIRCEAVDSAGNLAPVIVVARVPHDGSGR